MKKTIVVFDSKYGNTKGVAEKIVEGMSEVEGLDVALLSINDVNINNIPNYDVIVIGTPNHMGGPTRNVKKFIDKLGKLDLTDKLFCVFDTYMGGDFEKAVKKMESKIKKEIPWVELALPGLSIRVEKMKGPVAEGEYSKCRDFGVHIRELIK